jgi:hypothetical protein
MREIISMFSCVFFCALAVSAMAADYDLVINNGRVMDPETNYDAVANVGIKDGKIAVISKEKVTGKETIDATGLVVAPGFIDEHSHWTRPMGYKLGLRDGVTSAMDLEMGTLGYMREGVTAREMFEVQKVAANYGRQTAAHLRYTPGDATTEPIGAQEVLANALALGAPAIICHFNNPGWDVIQELLVRLQKRGYNVWGEIYPYRAGSTALNAVFLQPETWLDKLGYKYEDTLMDPATGKFYTRQTYEADIKKDPTKIVIVYKMPEEDVAKWLALPGVAMASDGMPIPGDWAWDTPYDKLPNTHPRTAGAHGATLRLGREHKIPLMQSLAQLSYIPAKHLGEMGLEAMKVRGRMQTGMVADMVVFDPQNVKDNSTYAQGALPTTGIPYVVVNGVVVVRDSKVLQDVNPGQAIRFEPEAKGRFQPLTKEGWRETFLVAPVDFCGVVPFGHSRNH